MKCKNNLVIVARMPPKHVISHGNNVKFITHYYSLRIIDNLSDFFFCQQLFLVMGELYSFEAVHCMFHLLAVINIFVRLFLFSAINEPDKTFFFRQTICSFHVNSFGAHCTFISDINERECRMNGQSQKLKAFEISLFT